jgi:murein DD-endopeptidase MepM/ murein hydrolase activator NlpD
VVKKGEDMGGIATLYGVKIKDLRAANAEIDPRMIPIGTVLIIPSGNPEQDANKPTAIPVPAVTILTGPPVCYADIAGGAWCLIKVDNNTETAVEDISVDFVLSGSSDEEPQIRAAFGLLDRLIAGQSIPLAAYFDAAPAQPWKVDTRLRTTSPAINEEARYLHSQLDKAVVTLAEDKLSARVNGLVNLQADQSDANIILVVAAAYNTAGLPVGVRRWESPVGLESGSGLVYDFNVFSMGGQIDKVDVLLETRPK